MNANYELKTEEDKEEQKEFDNIQNHPEIPSKKSSLPKVAGILLILAGILAIINWVPLLFLDIETIEGLNYIYRFQQIDPSITPEQVLGFLSICSIIGIIISIFPILGGILSIKRKLFGIALACSLIGIVSLGILFTSSILSIIGAILLIINRKEY